MTESNLFKTDPTNLTSVLDLFLKVENSTLPNFSKHKNTIVKYTKIPDYESKELWPHHSYSSQPRLRRIVTIEDQVSDTTRSLKPGLVTPVNIMSNNYPKRKIKIITIADDDSNRYSQPYSAESRHHIEKSRDLSNTSEILNTNLKDLDNKLVRTLKNEKMRSLSEKGTSQNTKNTNKSRISLSKNTTFSIQNEKESLRIKQRLPDELKNNQTDKPSSKKKYQHNEPRDATVKKPITVKPYTEKRKQIDREHKVLNIHIDRDTEVKKAVKKDICVETNPLPSYTDQITQISNELNEICKSMDDKLIQTETIKDAFDNLAIPDVTLRKETKDVTVKEITNFGSKSLPNLKIPTVDVISIKNKTTNDTLFHKGSYIIGRATVTYTTEQKIDFHVVNNEEIHKSISPSLAYPLNIVSVYKKEIQTTKNDELVIDSKDKEKSHPEYLSGENNNSTNLSKGRKLVKPSDIISTIRLNNSLLQSDFISEQFQRELQFIDSFFESLQYLERLTEKSFTDANVDGSTCNRQFEVNNSDCNSYLTKIESGNVDDTETMASKSLCQLNLLIHNEQRRARDFLFVLKMQEDVLKDYIKSQMLWLEKKKKQDNTDISALKKKQRGALLKLQHECGEMQRMRKALLTLSEKRKVALMKTKKNIEMKLKNNVDVEQIILGKKKLKRNIANDRSLAPLKCFDLSSSGCEDTSTSRAKSESAFYSTLTIDTPINPAKSVTSAEKSIQTGDSVLEGDLHEQTNPTAAENCVVVDGGYLNILFHNLALPQIFSNSRQYEVNEEALKNIVQSSNSNKVLKDTAAIEKFMNQIKNFEMDESSTDSTAHSLVEEFDQYFKCLSDEEKSLTNSPECDNHDCMLRECAVQTNDTSDVCDHTNVTMIPMDSDESLLKRLSGVYGIDRPYECELPKVSVDTQASCREVPLASVAGPLPVPAGAAAPVDSQPVSTIWVPSETSSGLETSVGDEGFCPNITNTSQYASPVLYEAEELRRQQLAIEREIKALELQQCHLLVVREIPDKPPPPYTPPTDSRAPKPPRLFQPDASTEDKVQRHFVDLEDAFELNDRFDAFVKDFCEESIKRQNVETSDKPWDACNLLPQRTQPSSKKTIQNTTNELKEVLSGVTPSYVSGVSSKRTDHIDDILFAEWRRCEPEWTSLHTDEAIVKNQLFENIFQKVLNEAVDEYKSFVCNKNADG
ncbi:uncharacterized protein [Battus philenor]|uniref:uncharacterized protein n=1 Tax=Battus philenor TaxID=42288 RepID=UPI0035CFB29F